MELRRSTDDLYRKTGETEFLFTINSNDVSDLELFKYKVMIVSLADEENLFTQILQSDLPKTWRSMSTYSDLQKRGSDWYTNKKSLVLKVPSAVIPQEYNYIINAAHQDFKDKFHS